MNGSSRSKVRSGLLQNSRNDKLDRAAYSAAQIGQVTDYDGGERLSVTLFRLAVFSANASRSCATTMWITVGPGCSIAVQTGPVRSKRQRSPVQVASPLAGRPYDLRHAALTTWLNAGIPPGEASRRAGNSVEVLLRRYAGCCLDKQREIVNRRIERAMRAELSAGLEIEP